MARIERIPKYSHINDDITGQLVLGVSGISQARDRLQWTILILSLRRTRWVSDQMLGPAYMAIYGRISNADRGHKPDFSLSRANE